jgi:hypothetical protein
LDELLVGFLPLLLPVPNKGKTIATVDAYTRSKGLTERLFFSIWKKIKTKTKLFYFLYKKINEKINHAIQSRGEDVRQS